MSETPSLQAGATAGRAGDLVGRGRELSELADGLREAVAGRGRMFLISGEPGIGKTRLADEVARLAAEQGATVCWGRCWEGGGAPAYWPWTQIFRRLVRDVLPPQAEAQLAATSSLLAHLLPESPAASALPATISADAEDLRFQLFDAANRLVQTAAATPLAFFLDDLHAADPASLLLLRFVARDLRNTALLVIATYREAELRLNRELAEAIAELARESKSLPLRGLSARDVGGLIEASIGREPPTTLVTAVHEATGGNPFFVDEVVRLMRAEGRFEMPDTAALVNFELPEQVREAVRRQLRLLPPATSRLLAAGAVLGQEFTLSVLQAMTAGAAAAAPGGGAGDEAEALVALADELGPAVRAGVLRCLSEAGARYAFAHALIRETLYENLAPSERAALHAKAGGALEALYADSAQPPLAQLAHHYVVAGSDKGLDYAQRTADDALHRLAYEEGLRWFETALAALERSRPEDDDRRLAFSLGAGEAAKGAGDFDRARGEFLRAADLARRLGRPQLLAQAALGVQTPWLGDAPDEEAGALVEEALHRLDPTPSALRAQLMVLLARREIQGSARDRAVELTDGAVAMARGAGDPRVLALALLTKQFLVGNEGRVEAALAIGAEALGALAEVRDTVARPVQHVSAASVREITLYLRIEQLKNHLWRGEMALVEDTIAEFAAVAAAYRKPYWLTQVSWMRALVAATTGRFREAEELAAQATADEIRLSSDAGPERLLLLLRALLARETGAPSPLPAGTDLPAEVADLPTVRGALTALAADGGREAEARHHLERAAARRFHDLGQAWVFSIALAHWAEACAAVGDRERARALYEILEPHAGLAASLNFYFSVGSTARYLGLLAATLGEWTLAGEHFEAALEMNARMNARPWLAHAQHDYAAMLVRRPAAGEGQATQDRARASDLARQAADTARALGMRPLLGRATALLERLGPGEPARGFAPAPERDAAPASGDLAASRPPSGAVFRRDGEYWTLGYRGKVCRMKDTRGLSHIATLLRHPGREIHCTELVDAGESAPSSAPADATDHGSVRADLGDAGEIIDAQAHAAYRRRLGELQAEIEEAQSFNDTGRTERLQAERETLLEELRRAMGKGGRRRRVAAHAERARINVGRAVRAALQRIAVHHPALASHLRATLKTGTFCCYRSREEALEWEF